MKKNMLVVVVIIVAGTFLVARVAGKRGAAPAPVEIPPPVALEAQVVRSETKSDFTAATVTNETTSLPMLKISADSRQIPQSLSVVMGGGDKNDYFVRIKAVHALGKDLSDSEVEALYILLNRKNGEDGLPLEQLNAIKNDVVNVLKAQTRLPVHLVNNLMAMYFDKSHDCVWRDYCVQHLGGLYARIDSGDEQRTARNLFWAGTHETDSSIAGTALIALANNTEHSDITKDAVANMALLLSEDTKCGELARITALQICAKLEEKKVLPTARQIAESAASVPLRMSALAAVGTLGEMSDSAMLEKYAASTDTRLRTAAQSALKRLGKSRSDGNIVPQ